MIAALALDVIDLLTRARDNRIAKGWTREYWARTVSGQPIGPCDEYAAAWTAVGALLAETPFVACVFDACCIALKEAAGNTKPLIGFENYEYQSPDGNNDLRIASQSEAIAWFTRAIDQTAGDAQ